MPWEKTIDQIVWNEGLCLRVVDNGQKSLFEICRRGG